MLNKCKCLTCDQRSGKPLLIVWKRYRKDTSLSTKHCKTFATLPSKYESLLGSRQDANDLPGCLGISIFNISVTKAVPRRNDWCLLYSSKKMVQYWRHRWFKARIYRISIAHKFIFQYSGQCISKQQNAVHTPTRTVLMKNFIQAYFITFFSLVVWTAN